MSGEQVYVVLLVLGVGSAMYPIMMMGLKLANRKDER